MKHFVSAIFLFVSAVLFSQNKSFNKTIEKISKADTVYFTADNSGCFDSYILEVKMCKQKSGGRKLLLKSKKGADEKTISAKNYKAFIDKYKISVNHFIVVGKGKCTSTSSFQLMYKIDKERFTDVTFNNSTCEAEYNPEMFLQGLFRANESTKK